MTGNSPFQVVMIVLKHNAAEQGLCGSLGRGAGAGAGTPRECEMEQARGS